MSASELPPALHDAVVAAVARVLAGASSERVVRELLRGHRELDAAGRALVARRVTGVSVLRRRLAHVAGDDDARALVDAFVATEERGESVDARQLPSDDVARIGVERSCPDWIVHDLVRALGVNGADAFLAASNLPAPPALRANTLRCTRGELATALAADAIVTRASAVTPHGLVVVPPAEGRANLFGSHAWRNGWFEVQDEASQRVAVACDAQPNDVVVDLCAGRGGKTLALAAAMNDEGILWAHDVDVRLWSDLVVRTKRAGVSCVRQGICEPGEADVVLVDAPCSSLGPLRRSPDLRWRLQPHDVAALPTLQAQLLAQALTLVKPGGRVVYATCTVRREENDDVVAAAAAGARVVATERWLPHVHDTDGFFIAILRA